MDKPLLTFALVAYNQERYVRAAVQGALAQTYSPMEIILSDDSSSDHTFEIMQEEVSRYRGAHTVRLVRNHINLGLVGHLNVLAEQARGELIIGAAGDDVSLPQRTQTIYEAWQASGRKALSLYSNCTIINEDGVEMGELWHSPIGPHQTSIAAAVRRKRSWVFGSSHAFAKRLFTTFGPLDDRIMHEDMAIPFRALLLGSIVYLHESLVYYRRHDHNTYVPNPTLLSPAMRTNYRRKVLRNGILVTEGWIHDLGLTSVPRRESYVRELDHYLRVLQNELDMVGRPAPAVLARVGKALLLGAKLTYVYRYLREYLFWHTTGCSDVVGDAS